MTEVHYRTQIEALKKNWKRMVKIRCDKVDCSGNCQRLYIDPKIHAFGT